MSIFSAPQWDVDERSDKLANAFGGSAPSSSKKKSPKLKKKKSRNDSTPVSNPISETHGDKTISTPQQASGNIMKKLKAKAGSSLKVLKGKDPNISNGTGQVEKALSKSALKKLKKKEKAKTKTQQLKNISAINTDVESTQPKISSQQDKSESDGTPLKKSKNKKLKKGKITQNVGEQSKMERLFEVKRKKIKAKQIKSKKGRKAITTEGKKPSLPFHPTNSPLQPDNKKMLNKLKRKEKKEKQKETLVNNNEVVLNKSKKKQMHKAAKKVSKGKQKYLKDLKDEQGETNPSFDTSLAESVSGTENVDLKKKTKKKKKNGNKKLTQLSDSVDGNFISSSKKFKLGPIEKEVVSRIPESNDITDKAGSKKLIISKLMQKANVFENTTSHDLKRKRRTEIEGGSKDLNSSNPIDAKASEEKLSKSPKSAKKKHMPTSLRQKMTEQLQSARFRWLNEQLYCSKSWEALKYFKEDEDAFDAYHTGYRNQVAQWPVNPVNIMIEAISSMPNDTVVADFGCGEAALAEALPNYKVHSLDLVAKKPGVIACDMAHSPLLQGSVDVAVFCLSLMGTNLNDFVMEANRVLKNGGLLKIAEVESRFEDIDNFTSAMVHFGFQLKKKDLDTQLFIFMDFKKVRNASKAGKLPTLSLEPCVYKKR